MRQKILFLFFRRDVTVVVPALIAPATVKFFHPLVEERFCAPGIDRLSQDLLPVRNSREQIRDARRLVGFDQSQQRDCIHPPPQVVSSRKAACQNLAAARVLPSRPPGNREEQGPITGWRKTENQFKHRLSHRALKSQAMNKPLYRHFA